MRLGLEILLAWTSAATETPWATAILESVSPGLMTYVVALVGGLVLGGGAGAGGEFVGPPVLPDGSAPGITRVWPAKMRFGLTMLFAAAMADTETPKRLAIEDKVSPGWIT